MACNAAQLLADGIAFQDLAGLELKAVQLQLAAEWLLLLDPAADITADGILTRAKDNGICCLDRNQLRASMLENLCNWMDNPSTCVDQTFPGEWTVSSPISSARVAQVGPGNYYAGIFSITISAGTYTTIDLVAPGIDTYLYLLDDGGNVVASDDDSGGGGNSRITQYYSAAGGTFSIQATTYDPDVTGSFTVQVDKCASPCDPINAFDSLTGASPFSTHIGSNDHRMKEYTFEALSGDEVLIFMHSTAFDPYLILIDPSGNVIAEQDNIFPSQTDVNPANTGAFIHWNLTATGTYTIQATTAVAGATGAFGVGLFCDCDAFNAQATGDPGTFGSTVGTLGWIRYPLTSATGAFTASGGSVHMEAVGDDPPGGSACDITTTLFANCNPYTVTMELTWDVGMTDVTIVVDPTGLNHDPVFPSPYLLVKYPEDGGSNSRTVTFTCSPNPASNGGTNPYFIRILIQAPFVDATYTLDAVITPSTPPQGEFP